MVHNRVDELPKPSEGIEGWNRYMARNIKYPQSSRESNTQGTVIVGFEVKEDGTVANVEVIRGIGGECDEEVVRIIAEGPVTDSWKKVIKLSRPRLVFRFGLCWQWNPESLLQNNKTRKQLQNRFGKHVTVVGYQAR